MLTGSDMNVSMPLTYQDDGWPDFSQDATIYVQLPTTGAYYLGVQDCNGLFSSGLQPAPTEHHQPGLRARGRPHLQAGRNPEVLAAATNTWQHRQGG